MGIQERKEREKAERRRAILEIARNTIRNKTYEEITMEELASQLELSRATLYLYFRNKSEIYATLLTEGMYELRRAYDARLNELSDVDPVQKLRAMAIVFFEFYHENHSYFDLMITKREELLKDLSEEALLEHKKSGRAIIEPLVTALEAGHAAGLIANDHPPRKIGLATASHHHRHRNWISRRQTQLSGRCGPDGRHFICRADGRRPVE